MLTIILKQNPLVRTLIESLQEWDGMAEDAAPEPERNNVRNIFVYREMIKYAEQKGNLEIKRGKKSVIEMPETGPEDNLFNKVAGIKPEPELSVLRQKDGARLLACLWNDQAGRNMNGWHSDLLQLVHFKEIRPCYEEVVYLLPCSADSMFDGLDIRGDTEQFIYLLRVFDIRLLLKHSDGNWMYAKATEPV